MYRVAPPVHRVDVGAPGEHSCEPTAGTASTAPGTQLLSHPPSLTHSPWLLLGPGPSLLRGVYSVCLPDPSSCTVMVDRPPPGSRPHSQTGYSGRCTFCTPGTTALYNTAVPHALACQHVLLCLIAGQFYCIASRPARFYNMLQFLS